MKRLHVPLLALAVLAAPTLSLADPDKHRHGRAEYKQEYWDGHCKVERKVKKNGDYKEKRKCKAQHARRDEHRHEHRHTTVVQPVYVTPAPVVVAPPPPVVLVPPPRPDGIVINGTIHLK